MRSVALIFIFAFSFVVISGVQSAHATATMKLKSGNSEVIIVDNGVGDDDENSDIILFNGAVGAYTTNISTGIRAGTERVPEFDLVSYDGIKTLSGGTLEIWLSDVGFGPIPIPARFDMSSGGTQKSGGTISFSGYIDSGNVLFGEGTLLGTQGPWFYTGSGANSAFAGDTSGSLSSISNPYSMTLKATLAYTGKGSTSFNSTLALVPEPISSTLFMVGGVLLGIRSFRKMKKA